MSDKIEQFKIQSVDVGSIKPSPYNPRKISGGTMEKLKKSLKMFGLVDPIIVNKANMTVVGGNQRLKALSELGVDKVNAVMVDLDEQQEKALNVALNKISGEWDFDKLRTLITGLNEIDPTLTGFDIPEIELMVGDLGVDLPPSDSDGDSGGDEEYGGEPVYRTSSESSSEPSVARGDGEKDRADGVSYTVYISFATQKEAEDFLAENGVQHKFKGGNRTYVWRPNK